MYYLEGQYMSNNISTQCYITFGQVHAHSINGKTLDKDCVATFEANSLEDGYNKAMKIFNQQFHHCTKELPDLYYYPRGIIKID